MPADPIARWESEGGSILAIERLRLGSWPGTDDPPQHMPDGTVASPPEIAETPRSARGSMPECSTEQACNPHRESSGSQP